MALWSGINGHIRLETEGEQKPTIGSAPVQSGSQETKEIYRRKSPATKPAEARGAFSRRTRSNKPRCAAEIAERLRAGIKAPLAHRDLQLRLKKRSGRLAGGR